MIRKAAAPGTCVRALARQRRGAESHQTQQPVYPPTTGPHSTSGLPALSAWRRGLRTKQVYSKRSAATFNRLTSPDRYRGRDRGKVAAIELLRSDPMKRSTVDPVVTGDETAAVAAAVDAVRRGQRVLVVLRSAGARVVSRLRRPLPSREESADRDDEHRNRLRGRSRWRGGGRRPLHANGPPVRRERARIPVVRRFDTAATRPHRRLASGDPENRAATWRHVGDGVGMRRAEVEVRECVSRSGRQGFETDADRP